MAFLANRPVLKGVLIGVGASALCFAAYKKNEAKVDTFLRSHGINVKTPGTDYDTMSIEELMCTKETIEDIIAEKELEEESVTIEADEDSDTETADDDDEDEEPEAE